MNSIDFAKVRMLVRGEEYDAAADYLDQMEHRIALDYKDRPPLQLSAPDFIWLSEWARRGLGQEW